MLMKPIRLHRVLLSLLEYFSQKSSALLYTLAYILNDKNREEHYWVKGVAVVPYWDKPFCIFPPLYYTALNVFHHPGKSSLARIWTIRPHVPTMEIQLTQLFFLFTINWWAALSDNFKNYPQATSPLPLHNFCKVGWAFSLRLANK